MLELIISAIQAIMQVIVIVFIGAILSAKGYIDNDKQKWLSKFNLIFFTPCLLYSNIASVISFEKLFAFWPIPVFYVVFTLISWILGQLITPMFGIDKYYKRFVLACIMFCNTNSLPVAIISSLAVSEAGKTLYWGPEDTQETVSARGISYTLFFGLFCNILRWSYGYNLLQRKAKDDDDTIANNEQVDYEVSIGGKYSSSHKTIDDNDSSRRSSSATVSEIDSSRCDSSSNDHNKQPLDFSNLPININESTRLLTPLISSQQHQQEGKQSAVSSKLKQIFASIDKYMSPPLYAAFLALFVGLCPPLKHLMYDRDSFFYASITKAIETCGKTSVPIVLVTLGAQLKSIHDLQLQQRKNVSSTTKRGTTKKSKKPISVSIFIRMFLTPLCVLPIVFAFATWGNQWSELANDPMFIVSMIVVGCTPTAINLSQITQVNGIFEEEMLNVLFWSYGVVCIPICTFVVFLALLLVGSMN